MHARLALAAYPADGCGVHAGRYAHHQFARIRDNAFPPALGAGFGDHLPRALTDRAGHGNLEKALGVAHLARAVALPAAFDLAAGRGAAALAVRTGDVLGQGQGDFIALGRLGETDGQVVTQIRSGHGARTARSRGKAEEISENVAEVGENVLGAAEASHAAVALHARVPKAVIAGAFVRIAQYVVSLGGLLESLLSLGVAGAVVGYFIAAAISEWARDFVLSGGTAGLRTS